MLPECITAQYKDLYSMNKHGGLHCSDQIKHEQDLFHYKECLTFLVSGKQWKRHI